ncbi:MAG: MarR family EPS-associated transcriptional regulator [Burkholderiales bacterium]
MPGPVVTDEVHYRILKILETAPDISQRDLARSLGVSVGKANYCLRALIARGLIKANNFKNSRQKKAYVYYLTPHGIVEKTQLTARFLQRKMAEYEALRHEIESLQREVRG